MALLEAYQLRAREHPGQIILNHRFKTGRDEHSHKQTDMFTLTITPTNNLEFPVQLTYCACLFTDRKSDGQEKIIQTPYRKDQD